MKEECLICSAPLEYLETDILMECAICHKKENSKKTATMCVLIVTHRGLTVLSRSVWKKLQKIRLRLLRK